MGVALLAFVAIAEGMTAFMVTPAVDQVLHPSVTVSRIPLFKIPWTGEYFDLNQFFPPSIHHIWTIFAITVVVLFAARAIAEYAGVTQIQYLGHAATRDLRNAVYEKVLRQPMGFFQKNPTGRILSTVINDVEKTRLVLGDYLADLIQKSLTFVALILVMLVTNWKMTLAAAVLVPLVVLPVGKLGKKIRTSVEKSQTRLGDLSQILEETVSGKSDAP